MVGTVWGRTTLWKTTDGGRIFCDSPALFTGFAWGVGQFEHGLRCL